MILYQHTAGKMFFITENKNAKAVLIGISKRPTKGTSEYRRNAHARLLKHNITPAVILPTFRGVISQEIVASWVSEWDVKNVDVEAPKLELYIEYRMLKGWVCLNGKLDGVRMQDLQAKYPVKE